MTGAGDKREDFTALARHLRRRGFTDLVVYQPGVLPGGELFRPTVMLVAGHRTDGAPFLYEQVCGPGEVIAVPHGAWHVSYVLDGPAPPDTTWARPFVDRAGSLADLHLHGSATTLAALADAAGAVPG